MEQKEFKSFYKTVGGNEGNKCHYPTRLDTYGCGCSHDCSYCLDGETLITMSDFSTKPLKNIEIGDKIIGVDTRPNIPHYKDITIATVEDKWEVQDKSYKIILEDGRELICSGNHRWLSNRGWKYTTGQMTGKNRRPYLTTNNLLCSLPKIEKEHIETDDFKKGYLSGMIRGDGHLKEYHYNNRNRQDNQYHFRLVLKDVERNKSYTTIFKGFWNNC